MAVSDDALQQNEGSRAARPEPLPFLLFMCPVDTTSATHQAHNFSSLLPHIDLTMASSKEPMNRKREPDWEVTPTKKGATMSGPLPSK